MAPGVPLGFGALPPPIIASPTTVTRTAPDGEVPVDGNGSDASTPSEESARHEVERVAEDYIRGWYLGDAARLGRALHPDLVKRTPSDGGARFRGVTRQRMVALTEQGGGNQPGAPTTIVVDHVEGDIATARVGSPDYLDYLHIAKTPEGWRIVNILFHPRR